MSSCHAAAAGAAPAAAGAAGAGLPAATGTAVTSLLLVGNPNVGKSTLFNAMTGSRQRIMNAPGTTVELQSGTWRALGGDVAVLDLPGTYSLIARSPDERVVADAVAAPDDAVAVVVLDATALARSLYLLAQVAAAGRPLVAALTMLDVAGSNGGRLEAARLEALLGVPVVPLDPRSLDPRSLDPRSLDPRAGAGLGELARAVHELGGRRVRGVGPRREEADPSDPGDPSDPSDLAAGLAGAEHLFGWVERVLAELEPPPPARSTRTDVVDRALLNPWLGLPVFGLTRWTLFQLATSAAAPVMGLVDSAVVAPVSAAVRRPLDGWAWPWVEGLVVDGVLAGVGTVLTFLPLIAIMYAALALLEDSGYMARAALLADRAMGSLGLDGRVMLPLIIGFGCNVPALTATRTLPDARQRLLTGLLVPWTSCAARLTVYVLLAGVFFPEHAGTAIFALYLLSVALVVGGGWVLRRTVFRDVRREPLLLVLPAYQRPRLRPIARSVWSRVAAFAHRAGRIIVVTLTIMWALMALPAGGGHTVGQVPVEESVYGVASAGVAPVFAPAGFDDWHLTAALATGFVAKEVVVGSLAQAYSVQAAGGGAKDAPATLATSLRATFAATSGGHPEAAAMAFMVFVLGYTPCLATIAEQRRLFGVRWTTASVVAQLVVAWVLAVVVFQVGRLL